MSFSNRKKLYSVVLFLLLCVPFSTYSQQNYIHYNKVIPKLEKGNIVTGIWAMSLNLANARSIIEYNGFPTQDEAINNPMIDFVIVAMEHYPYDITALRTFLAGLNSKREVMVKGNLQPSVASFVRLPADGSEPVHAMIKQALDVGVHGVVIPHVSNKEEALKIVKACRYVQPKNSIYRNPEGNRGYAPTIASYLWGLTREEYYEHADVWPLNPEGDIMVIVMIEDQEGVNNIEEIVKVPGIGAVFFGPSDYRISTGNMGIETGEVDEALIKVKNACDTAGMPVVLIVDIENIDKYIKENFKMFIIGQDIDKAGMPGKVLDHLKANYYRR